MNSSSIEMNVPLGVVHNRRRKVDNGKQMRPQLCKRMRLQGKHIRFLDKEEVHWLVPNDGETDSSMLWYNREELTDIRRDIFICLANSKNGVGQNYDDFSSRGLEEIRKKKGHKREIRRREYLKSIVLLQSKQRLARAECPEELASYAVAQNRSAVLRAIHYAALDADEARQVYGETFPPRQRTAVGKSLKATGESHAGSKLHQPVMIAKTPTRSHQAIENPLPRAA